MTMDYGRMAQFLMGLGGNAQDQTGLPPTAQASYPHLMSQQDALMKARPGPGWGGMATPGLNPNWSAGVGVPAGMNRSYLPFKVR